MRVTLASAGLRHTMGQIREPRKPGKGLRFIRVFIRKLRLSDSRETAAESGGVKWGGEGCGRGGIGVEGSKRGKRLIPLT